MSKPIDPWKQAMRDAGGADALARKCGIARRTLFKFKAEGVPASHLEQIHAATGIPPAQLAPKLAGMFGVPA